MTLPPSLGDLREAVARGHRHSRSVKDELRANLSAKLRNREPLFPGIVGYDDTVIPQVVNAILSKHNFILLGLRGQAKTRILRALTTLLDPLIPVVPGCELHDDPLAPLCAECRARVATEGDHLPIAWWPSEQRYVEKLATPDVTIADLIGDVDPIKAARSGRELGDELTMHYGLLPRANRGIFAVNELPDLASKVQVGLFNILQEGDVQIKGYPVRLRLDVLLTFSANPEDYTARGKIITPLKDRIGSEIRTHYPRVAPRSHGDYRAGGVGGPAIVRVTRRERLPVQVPQFVREIVEEIAFLARVDQKVDKRSGVSQRLPITTLETVVSNAERRALVNGEAVAVPRVSDIYAALPSLTGKIELEYEGELKGAEVVARELVRQAVGTVFDGTAAAINTRPVVQWFEQGGSLELSDTTPAEELLGRVDAIDDLDRIVRALGSKDRDLLPVRAAVVDFLLEGLCALKRISRTDEGKLFGQPAGPRKRPEARDRELEQMLEDDEPMGKGKKKYYN